MHLSKLESYPTAVAGVASIFLESFTPYSDRGEESSFCGEKLGK